MAEDERYTIRDVTDNKVISVYGRDKVFLIGLGGDGSITAVETREDSAAGIYVTLVQLMVCENGGMILVPINRDLCCTINEEVITSEINLLSGVPFEVADKTIKIYQGRLPGTTLRRKLPATPGMVVRTTPPPKPRRSADLEKMINGAVDAGDNVSLPEIDINLLSNIKSASQLANLAASFLTKQINLYTDSKLSAAITDQIFAFLQEISSYQSKVLEAYITEISQSLEEMPEAERNQPLHRPAVRLLVELLRQVMDPLSHVVLCLQLLRTFSHFPQNVPIMIQCQATPAILGSMTVYLDVTEVQQYGLDILAKIALYKPSLTEKIPIRETALEMILRAMKRHNRNLNIVQPGCRTLSNLTSMLQEVLDSLLETDYNCQTEIEEGVQKYDSLLCHIFDQGMPSIQRLLQEFPKSLDVRTEGRRFLYNYSKMTHFMQRQKLRALPSTVTSSTEDLTHTLTTPSRFIKAYDEPEPTGILKKSEEKLFPTSRMVHFADDSRTLDYLTSSESDASDSDLDVRNSLDVGPLLVVKETKVLSRSDAAALRGKEICDEHMADMDMASVGTDAQGEESVVDVYKSEVKMEVGDQGIITEVSTKFGETEVTIATDGANSPVTLGPSPDPSVSSPDISEVDSVHSGIDSNDVSNIEECETLETKQTFSNQDGDPSESDAQNGEERVVPAKHPLKKQKSYCVSDIVIYTGIIRLQVTHYVSSLVNEGNDSLALAVIDKPLREVLRHGPEELVSYVSVQYEPEKTLMDVDTAFLISLIDAVRYKSLFKELLQKNIRDVVNNLFGEYYTDALALAVSCLLSVFRDSNVMATFSDKAFLTEIGGDLHRAYGILRKEVPDLELLSQTVFEIEPS